MSPRSGRTDILRDLHEGRLELDAAEALFDSELSRGWPRGGVDFHEALSLSAREYTAYLHGATLSDLVRLRYEGWPRICSVCGSPIDYRAFWWVGVRAGMQQVRHITCPDAGAMRAAQKSRAGWLRSSWLATLSLAIGYPVSEASLIDVELTASLRAYFHERVAAERTREAETVLPSDERERILRDLAAHRMRLLDIDAALFHEHSDEVGAVVVPAGVVVAAAGALLAMQDDDGSHIEFMSLEKTHGLSVRHDVIPGYGNELAYELVGWGLLSPGAWLKASRMS